MARQMPASSPFGSYLLPSEMAANFSIFLQKHRLALVHEKKRREDKALIVATAFPMNGKDARTAYVVVLVTIASDLGPRLCILPEMTKL